MLLRTIAGVSALVSCVVFACMGWKLWILPLLFIGIYAGLFALALLFLWAVCALVDLNKPQEEDSPFYRRVMHVYIEALIQLVRVRLHTKGLEKAPKEGRFLQVCNHLFIADPGIVLHCFRKSQLAFLTKKENYKLPFIGAFMHKILCQPIDRENDRQALRSILKCIQLIKEDKVSVCAFPEGYTSKDGKLHPFRPGVFKIAQKANVPIVVCTVRNTQTVFGNMKKLKPSFVELHLVDVITAQELKGQTTVDIANRVHKLMADDLGPDLVLQETTDTP